MGDIKYSLMWDAYNTNMCKGLSLLQQHGEFVDMTLAADGHLVKVHKMVMSLVSPFIKDLISSADCPHPVIFLNQISHETLTAILEYVYTGQVSVPKDGLTNFMEACKALHIKGFQELEVMHKYDSQLQNEQEQNTKMLSQEEDIIDESTVEDASHLNDCSTDITTEHIYYVEPDDHITMEEIVSETPGYVKKPTIQYSLSNHGNLQLILNRFVYNLRYSARTSGQQRWQCVDGVCKEIKCPARVTTHKDRVIGRSKPHNHPHHDKKILKKVEAGTIFTALHDAENQMHLIRKEKS